MSFRVAGVFVAVVVVVVEGGGNGGGGDVIDGGGRRVCLVFDDWGETEGEWCVNVR